MSSRTVLLRDLGGELRPFNDEGASRMLVVFDCPMCPGDSSHRHAVCYTPGERASGPSRHVHIWGHASGSSVDDITLTPSFLARGHECRLHVFIRSGALVILGDSVRHEKTS